MAAPTNAATLSRPPAPAGVLAAHSPQAVCAYARCWRWLYAVVWCLRPVRRVVGSAAARAAARRGAPAAAAAAAAAIAQQHQIELAMIESSGVSIGLHVVYYVYYVY
jgi:hypothetical protein